MKEKILEKPGWFFSLISFLVLWISGTTVLSTDSSANIGLILFPVTVIIPMVLLLYRGDKKHKKLLELLHDQCYPGVYNIEAQNILRLEQEKKRPKDVSLLKLYLSDGLYAAGKFEEAMKTLEDIEISRYHENTAFLADFYHRRFLISLEMKRQDAAWDSLVKMRETVMDMKNRSKRDVYIKMYDEGIHMFNTAKGEYEGAEETFKGMLERGKTNYERSFASYLLGGVYKHFGKEADAEDAYKYVLAWGNKLYIAGRSAEILGLKGWED